MNRRDFLKLGIVATAAGVVGRTLGATRPLDATATVPARAIPSYLRDYMEIYRDNPRQAALQWLREAKFGMFIHYGLYSLLGRGEWVQYREKIHVPEYAKLKEKFTAEAFKADAFVDLAVVAQMKYITITTRHHDSFCLFDTKKSDFNAMNSSAKRDLVKEMAEACARKGIGLCLYYSHGRDWRHPDAPNNDEWGGNARPSYNPPEQSYHYGKDHDLQRYIDFIKAQITELMSGYGPIAAIWLDGIMTPLSRKQRIGEWHVQELYDHIHSLQPQVLVSYKQGLIGTEDFLAPEHMAVQAGQKPQEICNTMSGGWGYVQEAKHKDSAQVIKMLAEARRANANLLLNTGPLGNGSIHSADAATLRKVGKLLRTDGFPT